MEIVGKIKKVLGGSVISVVVSMGLLSWILGSNGEGEWECNFCGGTNEENYKYCQYCKWKKK